jgi:hypothetical protein
MKTTYQPFSRYPYDMHTIYHLCQVIKETKPKGLKLFVVQKASASFAVADYHYISSSED